jgi:hypothetical protein
MGRFKDANQMSVANFFNVVGIITDYDQVEALVKRHTTGIIQRRLLGYLDDAGHFDATGDSLMVLKSLVDANPNLHIVSLTDSDSGNSVVYDNCIRIVNRINYYVADGNANKDLYAVEKF